MSGFLAEHSVTLVFAIIAVGSFIGRLSVRNIAIGPAAVLFTALAVSSYDESLTVPSVIGTLGLAIFAYSVGVTAGPSFFQSLRRGTKPITVVFLILAALGILTHFIGYGLGLDAGTTAGLYAGATTNTPGLAAALVMVDGAPGPTVGYSLTYVVAVAIMLVAASFALRRKDDPADDDPHATPEVATADIEVTRDNIMSVAEIELTPHGQVLFSRFQRPDGTMQLTQLDTVLRPGDVVHVVGVPEAIAHITKLLGKPSDRRLMQERGDVDFRRITLSRKELYGKTIIELGLEPRFRAVATRVRRADQDMLATDDFTVQAGDRIRVAAPRDMMKSVAKYLGDSDQGFSDINPLGFSLGLTVGLLVGALPLAIPGVGSLQLGDAAGPLLVGLVVGRIGRSGPLVWSMPHQASQTLTQLGLILFLAYAGGRAGSLFVDALKSPLGVKLILAGAVITTLHAVALLVTMRHIVRAGGAQTAGIVAASQTQPAVLAFVNEASRNDQRVMVGYALVYPVAMVTKIVVCQMLVLVG